MPNFGDACLLSLSCGADFTALNNKTSTYALAHCSLPSADAYCTYTQSRVVDPLLFAPEQNHQQGFACSSEPAPFLKSQKKAYN